MDPTFLRGRVARFTKGIGVEAEDLLAVEEPLEVALMEEDEVIVMPTTASMAPFVGLLGCAFLGFGIFVRAIRRHLS